jgi:hypothetical protein
MPRRSSSPAPTRSPCRNSAAPDDSPWDHSHHHPEPPLRFAGASSNRPAPPRGEAPFLAADDAAVTVGKLPYGIWPSGDGSRVYAGFENDDDAGDRPDRPGDPGRHLCRRSRSRGKWPRPGPARRSRHVAHVTLASRTDATGAAPTSVSLFSHDLAEVLEASVAGLAPKQSYILTLPREKDGSGQLEPIANPAGAAIINAARSANSSRRR